MHDLEFKVSDKMIDIQKRRGVTGATSPPANQAPGRSSAVEPAAGGRGSNRVGGATSPPQGSQGGSQGPTSKSSYRMGGSTSPVGKESGDGKVHDLVIKSTENVFDIVKRGQDGSGKAAEKVEESDPQSLTGMAGQGRGGRGSSGAFERGAAGGAGRSSGVGGSSGPVRVQRTSSGAVVAESIGDTPGEEYEEKPMKTGDITTSVKPDPPERSVKSRDSKQAPNLVKTQLQPSVKVGTAEIGVRKSREIAEVEEKKVESSSGSDTMFYVIFVLVSSLLFWNAITPTSRV